MIAADLPQTKQLSNRAAADLDVLRVIGFLQLQHGRFLPAVILFDALYSIFPSDLGIAFSLAQAHLQNGDPQSAHGVLEAIETRSVTDPNLQGLQQDFCFCWLRSQALAGIGQSAEAARWMRLFLRLRRQSTLSVVS